MSSIFQSPRHWFRSVFDRCLGVGSATRQERLPRITDGTPLQADTLVLASIQGMFPAHQKDGTTCWIRPKRRAVVSLDQVVISSELEQRLQEGDLEVRFDDQFESVIQTIVDRDPHWMNEDLLKAHRQLHQCGVSHCIEVYRGEQRVAGGLGLSIGNFFFLDNMFSNERHASSVAFVKLAEQLHRDGFCWLDCHSFHERWTQYGCRPVQRKDFIEMVTQGLGTALTFGGSLTKTQAPPLVAAQPLDQTGLTAQTSDV